MSHVPMLLDKYVGSLIGLAVGDALGTTLEFQRPGTFLPIKDIVGGGPFGLAAGQWTDDTSLALCLAESLIVCKGFDAKDQMDRYLKWYRSGYFSSTGACFGIGKTTRSAIEKYAKEGNPYSWAAGRNSAGNGSIMRLTPVALYYARNPLLAMRYCAESSRTTHGARECIDACRYLGTLIIGAINGIDKKTLLSPFYHPVTDYWKKEVLTPEISEIAAGSFTRKIPPDIKGVGYVASSLEAALWAFHTSNTFAEGALLAVNLGDDADTTGAVYGQLAGAFYGVNQIPDKWREVLSQYSAIFELAEKIYRQSVF